MYFDKDENKMVEDASLDLLMGFLEKLNIKRNNITPQKRLKFDLKKRGIDGVFYNESKGVVVIKWKDGKITKATCAKEDNFDLMVGFAVAYCTRKFNSKSHLNKILTEQARKMDKDNKKSEPEPDEKKKPAGKKESVK